MERNVLRTLGDNTPDLIYAKDRQGRFTFGNMAFLRMAGAASLDDILGKNDFDLNPPDLAQGYADDDQAVMRSGEPLVDREEIIVDAKTGESRWYSTTKVPLRDDAGNLIGTVGITRDITASKRAALQVRELNAELEERVAARTAELQALSEVLAYERNLMRILVDSVPDSIFAKDTRSKFLLANNAVARGMGATPQDLLGKDDFAFFPQDMAQRFYDDEQRLLQTGEPLLNQEEPAVNNQTGKMRWLLTSKLPVRNEAGEIVGLWWQNANLSVTWSCAT